MSDVNRTSENFLQNFDPIAYLKEYRTSLEGTEADGRVTLWMIQRLHEIFTEGNIKAKRLLDVGTGPSILSIISAAPHCDNIFLSDLTPQCREVLHQWLNNTLSHSFQPFFNFVVDKEGKGESPEERESKLRKKVVGILPIDVLKTQPLEPCFFSKFQLITSTLCFDTAVNSIGMYESLARNVDSLLEEGGHIAIAYFLDAEPYQVGNSTFDACKLTTEAQENIWKRLGYTVVVHKEHKQDMYHKGNFVLGGYALLVARKTQGC